MQKDAVFAKYTPIPGSVDEFVSPTGAPRREAAGVIERLEELGRDELSLRQGLADAAFLQGGVTFSVYGNEQGSEKIFPFDLIPRVIPRDDWNRIERGLIQRVTALNLFLADLYADQRIVKEGLFPAAVVERCNGFIPGCAGITPPGKSHINIGGIDLLRDEDGDFIVLEDNVRVPSGVSYVLENRAMMKRLMPRLFKETEIEPVDSYPMQLRRTLKEIAPCEGITVVLTPGPFNSAYFEHGYLARRMGVPLVQGTDLYVLDDMVFVKTIAGPKRVSTIYRRIDDLFLDPEAFNPNSMLGVRGLMRAYSKGNVALANAPGNGMADDKATYPFVPDIIRFYLSEEPILGQVETLSCAKEDDCKRVLDQLDRMVVKAVDGAGGYGMLVGPVASASERAEFADKLRADPGHYIAQPLVDFSTCPIWKDGVASPRRVDLRPFVLSGKRTWVLPGGLTRVALVEGSYVVNSSQGGGSKDTWVVRS